MKWSKDRKRAVRLLAAELDNVEVDREGRHFRIEIEGTSLPMHKSPIRSLAWLADLARRLKLDRAGIIDKLRWSGAVPSRGLAAWEEHALQWLQPSPDDD